MSWPTVALGEIFDIARGGSPRPIDDYITDSPDGVNWISIKDASNSSKYITSTAKKIRPSGVSRSRLVKPGDFLLTNSMSFGRPYILQTTGCIHDGWLVLSGNENLVDQDFFFHLLGSDFVYRKFELLAAGAVVKNLNIDLVASVRVPLPPLSEQRRIAAILDKAADLRAKRCESVIKLDRLMESVFLNMFGDPVTNPKGWPTVEFASAVEFLTGYPFRSPEFLPPGHGIKLCRGTNVLPSELDWSDEADWPISDINKFDRFKILAGDVIIAMDRPWISSGFKMVLVEQSDPPCLLVQRVARLRPMSHFGPNFIYALFASESFKRHCKPTETTIPHISPNDFRSFPILDPGASAIAAFEAVANKIKIQRQSLLGWDLTAERLFVSLQQRAFEGNL